MLKGRTLRSTLLAIAGAFSASVYAMADTPRKVNVPAGDLVGALRTLAQQSGAEFVYSVDQIKGVHTGGVHGEYTAERAVTQLLEDTKLKLTVHVGGAMLIARPPDGPASVAVLPWSLVRPLADGSSTESETRPVPSAKEGKSNDKKRQRGDLEEVTVTATRRQMNLQDVPFGLSAMTGDDLTRIGATGAKDYLAEMPGVHYTPLGRGRSPIVIRGVSTEGFTLNNLQNKIETYVDDLPTLNRFSAWTNTDFDVSDIERVEVLRGPQGTLFGSGALGGAIRIITNKPNFTESSAKLELGLATTKGGHESNNISAMINVPLAQDKVALRAVGYVRDDGGAVNNVWRESNDVDGGRTNGGRLMLGFRPTEKLDLRLSATHERDIVDDSPKTFVDIQDGNAYQWNGIIPERSDIEMSIFNVTGEYGFGAASLTSSTTYGVRHQFLRTDFIRVLAPLGPVFDPSLNEDEILASGESDAWIKHDTNSFAQELRLTSTYEGRLEWTVGTFFMKQDIDLLQEWRLGGLASPLTNNNILVNSKEKAVFGEATYKISKRLSVTVGARWFGNTFETERKAGIGGPGLIDEADAAPMDTTSHAVTPKIAFSLYPMEKVLLYATAAKGYRVGQINFNANLDPIIPTSFDPDSLWNYEIGTKSMWLGSRLKVNLAAFYIDWSDIQLGRGVTLPSGLDAAFTDNAGDATIKGVEGEFTVRPSERWEFGSSLTYTRTRLESVLPGVPLTPGSPLPGSPEFCAANYVQFTTAGLPYDASGYIRLSHRYVGKVLGEVGQTQLASEAYSVFGLRAGAYLGRYELALYLDNVADNDAATSRTTVVDSIPYAYRLKPRTVGLTFRAHL